MITALPVAVLAFQTTFEMQRFEQKYKYLKPDNVNNYPAIGALMPQIAT